MTWSAASTTSSRPPTGRSTLLAPRSPVGVIACATPSGESAAGADHQPVSIGRKHEGKPTSPPGRDNWPPGSDDRRLRHRTEAPGCRGLHRRRQAGRRLPGPRRRVLGAGNRRPEHCHHAGLRECLRRRRPTVGKWQRTAQVDLQKPAPPARGRSAERTAARGGAADGAPRALRGARRVGTLADEDGQIPDRVAPPASSRPTVRPNRELVRRLFLQYQKTKDPEVRQQLVELFNNLVIFLAKKL